MELDFQTQNVAPDDAAWEKFLEVDASIAIRSQLNRPRDLPEFNDYCDRVESTVIHIPAEASDAEGSLEVYIPDSEKYHKYQYETELESPSEKTVPVTPIYEKGLKSDYFGPVLVGALFLMSTMVSIALGYYILNDVDNKLNETPIVTEYIGQDEDLAVYTYDDINRSFTLTGEELLQTYALASAVSDSFEGNSGDGTESDLEIINSEFDELIAETLENNNSSQISISELSINNINLQNYTNGYPDRELAAQIAITVSLPEVLTWEGFDKNSINDLSALGEWFVLSSGNYGDLLLLKDDKSSLIQKINEILEKNKNISLPLDLTFKGLPNAITRALGESSEKIEVFNDSNGSFILLPDGSEALKALELETLSTHSLEGFTTPDGEPLTFENLLGHTPIAEAIAGGKLTEPGGGFGLVDTRYLSGWFGGADIGSDMSGGDTVRMPLGADPLNGVINPELLQFEVIGIGGGFNEGVSDNGLGNNAVLVQSRNIVAVDSFGREYKLLITFGHMSRVFETLKVGDPIKAGEPIGIIGDEGNATGDHLDFSMMLVAADGSNIIEGVSEDGQTFYALSQRNCHVVPLNADNFLLIPSNIEQ